METNEEKKESTGLMITPDDYHSDTSRISKSGLDKINKSPLHYWEAYLNPNRAPQVQTPALTIGSASHCAVFEPEEFKKRFIVAPVFDKRTTKGKADAEMFENKMKMMPKLEGIINQATYDQCMRIRDAVRKHPTASQLLQSGFSERKIEFIDEETDVKCKCKPDRYDDLHEYIVDLKTTEDASAEEFARSVWKYRYHVQAPFYTDGMINAGYPVSGFAFIAVEKSPPYAVSVFETPPNIMEMGRMRYLEDLHKYKKCIDTGIWTGYPEQVQPLQLPSWAVKNL